MNMQPIMSKLLLITFTNTPNHSASRYKKEGQKCNPLKHDMQHCLHDKIFTHWLDQNRTINPKFLSQHKFLEKLKMRSNQLTNLNLEMYRWPTLLQRHKKPYSDDLGNQNDWWNHTLKMAKTVAHTVCTDCKKYSKQLKFGLQSFKYVSPAWLWWIANYPVVLHSNSTWIFPRAESISWYFSLIRLFVTTSPRGMSTYPNDSFTHMITFVTKLTHKNFSIPT